MDNSNNYGSIPSKSNQQNRYLSRRRSSVQVYLTFIDEFWQATGGWQIILIGSLLAFGLGSIIGVIPEVCTQRFAEQFHGYDVDAIGCNEVQQSDKLEACILGGQDAQSAASYAAMVRNTMALLSYSIAGSYSDIHGRRGVMIASLILMTTAPIALIMIQINKHIHPAWYYALDSLSTGIISFTSVAFSMLADIMPNRHRSASYGLYMGTFFMGIAVGPFFATVLDHLQVAILSLAIRVVALVVGVLLLPETLPADIAEINRNNEMDPCQSLPLDILCKPIRELGILVQSKAMLLLSIASFCSSLVFSADVTIFFYYIEANLGFRDNDIALLMLLTGIIGFLLQAVFLKYLISLFGERFLLISCFCVGILYNILYGVARTKVLMYVAICISNYSNVKGALLSSLASRLVNESQQGKIQGALAALSALSEAVGPPILNYVYQHYSFFGMGTMFVVAAVIFFVGTVAAVLIPPKAPQQETGDNVEDETEPMVA